MTLIRACIAMLGLALAGGAAAAQADADQGWPAGERLISKYRAGKFAEVIAEAPAVLKAEPWNDELRLALANSLLWTGREWQSVEHFSLLLESRQAVSARLGMANGLAWTGRMDESLPHYQAVMDDSAFWDLYRKAEKGDIPAFPTPSDAAQRNEAKLGMANALRWMGRADKAHPLYLQLRASHPTSDIGEEGEFFARRELRARTTFNAGYAQDNTPMRRFEPLVSHQWRNDARNVIFYLEGTGGHDWDDRRDLDRRDFTFRVEALDLPLAPRVSVTQQNDPERTTFGDLRLQVTGWPLYVSAGRVNWGKLAFTTDALDLGLTANRYGVNGNYQVALGELRGFYNHFDVSDDNRVDAADVRLAFREWRPLGKQVKPFVGVNWRSASRTVPEYWSPQTYGLGYVGLEGEWERREWYFFALGQVGFKLAGEASTAWGASLIAKRWIGRDWSIGANAYALGGTRGANYRAEGVNLIVEKLW